MGKNAKNDSPEEKTKDPFADTRHWRSMIFVSRYKNLRVLDPKNLKRTDRATGETAYGTEMIFKTVGNMGMYTPKSQREAAILLHSPNVQLQGASVGSGTPSEQVVGVITAPQPPNVYSEKR